MPEATRCTAPLELTIRSGGSGRPPTLDKMPLFQANEGHGCCSSPSAAPSSCPSPAPTRLSTMGHVWCRRSSAMASRWFSGLVHSYSIQEGKYFPRPTEPHPHEASFAPRHALLRAKARLQPVSPGQAPVCRLQPQVSIYRKVLAWARPRFMTRSTQRDGMTQRCSPKPVLVGAEQGRWGLCLRALWCPTRCGV